MGWSVALNAPQNQRFEAAAGDFSRHDPLREIVCIFPVERRPAVQVNMGNTGGNRNRGRLSGKVSACDAVVPAQAILVENAPQIA